MTIPRTTIVVPCYNESSRIDRQAFLDFVRAREHIFFVLVEDGSTDNTRAVLQDLAAGCPERILVLPMACNMGKAETVRTGIHFALEKGTEYVGFFDADLATPLEEADLFISFLQKNKKLKMVTGCRVNRLGAEISRNKYRHYIGRVIATLISITLNLPTYDTQCGAKMFTAEFAEELFAEPFVSTWLFDVELLARAIHNHGREAVKKLVLELPLRAWQDMEGSKVSFSFAFKIPFELYRIHKTWLR